MTRHGRRPPPFDPRETPRVPRTYHGLVVDRQVGPLMLGKFLGFTGVWVFAVATALASFEEAGSSLAVGAVGAATFLPQVALALSSGARADSGDKWRQIVVGRLVAAIGAMSLAALYMIRGSDSWSMLLPLVIGALMFGTGLALGGPAMQAVLPEVVEAQELPSLVALDNVVVILGRIAGPILGAFVVAESGYAAAICVAAAANVAFAGLAVISAKSSRAAPRVKASHHVKVGSALSLARSDLTLTKRLAGVAGVAYGSDISITLVPEIAFELGVSEMFAGAMAMSFGVGALVGIALLPLVKRAVPSVWLPTLGLTALGVAGLPTGFAASTTTVALCLALAGFGMSVALTSLTVVIQENVDPSFRGRAMALWFLAFVGVRPVASALNGAAADLISLEASCGLIAGVSLLAAALQRPTGSTRATVPTT